MKAVSVRDLRNKFGKIAKWLEAGQTVQILKRGRPIARLTPEPSSKCLLGSLEGSAQIPDDIDDPLPVQWEATS